MTNIFLLVEVKAAMEGMLAPTLKEQVTATIEVREVFNITKVGLVSDRTDHRKPHHGDRKRQADR